MPSTPAADATADRRVLDSIATLLGTSPEWRSAADYLESIANLVGQVRPHPGGHDTAQEYRDVFEHVTGRPVVAAWDSGDE